MSVFGIAQRQSQHQEYNHNMKLQTRHLPFLALATLALLAALWAGLMRLGWQLPALTPSLALAHGPLMISGSLGTLITLERAVAIKQKWMYLPPLLSGLGWLVAVLLPSSPLGAILIALASLGGVTILLEMTRREPALHIVKAQRVHSAFHRVIWLLFLFTNHRQQHFERLMRLQSMRGIGGQ